MQLLSIKAASDLLAVKESTLRTWIARKQIPQNVVFRIGNTVRIREEQFNRWINGNDSI